jgi:uncharacterized protein YfaS (alpha-2-macroglobulin family)
MGQSDEWGSNYAGHFLIEASNSGYAVNDYMLQQWKQYQRNRANSWVVNSSNFYGADLNQAYRLYTLALAKSPELGAMNRLKEFRYLSVEAKWRLAAAYKLAGQEETALQLISGLATTFPERTNAGYTYGSALRDEAMVLETLTLLNKRTTASGLVYDIAAKLSRENWYSTQTTAYSILAIARYCGKNPSGEKINAKVTVGAKVVDINAATYIRQIPISLKAGVSNIQVNNNGANTLYLRLITQGQPFTGDSINVPNNPALLAMNVSYLSADGKPMDISKITQGSDFIAKVVIKNTGKRGAYSQMSLSQIFPSGWEILNARMVGGEGAYQSSPATYQDIRDDRVYTYFNIQQNETLTYYVQLNAAYLGKFYLPATVTEAMYDRTISAGIGGKWVEVVK